MSDLNYMVLSALAYEDPDYVEEKAPYFGYSMLAYMTDGPAQGYLFVNIDEAVVAYRGTEASEGDLWDIASNVRVHAREWEGPGKAHLGYVRHYRRVRDDLQGLIKMVPSRKPLVVTGHSLGGAVATVAAAHDCAVMDWQFWRLVTFGAPAALDKEAHDAITCTHTRYVNSWDPAPCWPPSFTIRHHVDPVKISSGWGLKRHGPAVYIKAMEKFCEESTDNLLAGSPGGL